MSLETNRIIRPKNYTYQRELDILTGLNPGEFIAIDNKMSESFRTTVNAYTRLQPTNRNIRYKSLRVSKNKTYFFKVDTNKPM